MTKTEKEYVAIFVASFIVGIAFGTVCLWALYALLTYFMGATLAICLIAGSYLVGNLSGLASIKKSDGTWLLNFWIFNVIRKIAFWEINLITRTFAIIKKAGEPEIISEPAAAAPAADAQ